MTTANASQTLLRGLVVLALVAGLVLALLWPPPAWGAGPAVAGAGAGLGQEAVVPMPTVTGGEGRDVVAGLDGEDKADVLDDAGLNGARVSIGHESGGAALFRNHCAGCHVNGGNIIRRGRTLKLKALERNGIDGPEAIAAIASAGVGQMGGYGEELGEGGPEAVAAWVWQQAQAGWPKG